MGKKLTLILFILWLSISWVFSYSQNSIKQQINKIFNKKDEQFNLKYRGSAYNICINEQKYYKKVTNTINKVINLPKYKKYESILNMIKHITEKKSQICTIKIQADLKKYTFVYRPIVDLKKLTPLMIDMFESNIVIKFMEAVKQGNDPNLTVVPMKLSSISVKMLDMAKRLRLHEISIALTMYFNNYGMYPISLNKLAPTYISKVPTNPINNKQFFYKLLDKNGFAKGWAIIWVKMGDVKNCNINVYSEQELNKIIKQNNNDSIKLYQYLIKLKQDNTKFNKWCYYIRLN